MLKNLIMYADFSGKERILPLDKEINGVDFNEIVSFTVVNQKCRVSNCTSTAERYVVGIPYRYPFIDRFAYLLNKQELKYEVLNYGEIVSEKDADYCYEFKTDSILQKKPNLHIVPNQSELLRILMEFIKENGQTIGTQQKPVSRVRK